MHDFCSEKVVAKRMRRELIYRSAGKLNKETERFKLQDTDKRFNQEQTQTHLLQAERCRNLR